MKTNQNNSCNVEEISYIKPRVKGEKILLHSCCAPCTLEPYRILAANEWDITIFYSNNNIYPESEYIKRYNTLKNWANNNNITVICDDYTPENWENEVMKYGKPKLNTNNRIARCTACYMHRLVNAAQFARNQNINNISSTLAVSPYQLNDSLKICLNIVSDKFNLNPIFMDFRPFYKNAVITSKELNMYRQKYCGCKLSLYESIEQFKRTKNNKYLNELLMISNKENQTK